MIYIPATRKALVSVTPWSFTCIKELRREMLSSERSSQSCCYLIFIIQSTQFNLLTAFSAIVQLLAGICIMSVWSQLKTSRSGILWEVAIFLISSKNCSLQWRRDRRVVRGGRECPPFSQKNKVKK